MESWKLELRRNELYHHGIKGQEWGVKNGPPYPLDKATHKAVIKKERRKRVGQVVESAAVMSLVAGVASTLISGMNPMAGAMAAGMTFAANMIMNVGNMRVDDLGEKATSMLEEIPTDRIAKANADATDSRLRALNEKGISDNRYSRLERILNPPTVAQAAEEAVANRRKNPK